jgi:hypothetical protein
VLLIAALLVCGVLAWHAWMIFSGSARRLIGDGTNVDTYGFDLSHTLVPRNEIVASRNSKDGFPALTDPRLLTLADLAERARHRGGKYLVSGDRVLGVEISGQARAYPLDIMAWHQVVNDTLGGRSILVTYDPLCDASVVFDRKLDRNSAPVEFGVSGLLYNSNLLAYDRQADPARESLWCQLQFRAIAGPAAADGRTLEVLPSQVVRWADWRDAHPDTTVIEPLPSMSKVYKNSFKPYFGSGRPRFPVSPLPPDDGTPLMTPVVAFRIGDRWYPLRFTELVDRVDADGVCRIERGARAIGLRYHPEPPTAEVFLMDGSPQPPTVHAFWFAWYAVRSGRE